MDPGIIFLDVNGVLQPFSSELCNGTLCAEHKFSPLAMAQLARMVHLTGAELVLSSSWRLVEDSRAMLSDALSAHGMTFTRTTTHINIDGARASQVLAFLADHAPGVDSWVIFDDEDVTKGREGAAMMEARQRLVRTDGRLGLTERDADVALSILSGRASGN